MEQTVLQLFPFRALPALLGQGSLGARIVEILGCATLGRFARIRVGCALLLRLTRAAMPAAGGVTVGVTVYDEFAKQFPSRRVPAAGGVTVARTVQDELAKQSPSQRVPAAGGVAVGRTVLGRRSAVRAACRSTVNVPIQIAGQRALG